MSLHRPISKAFPEVADVLRDPARTLSRGPVVIVDRPMPVVIGFVVAAGIMYLLPDHLAKVIVFRYLFVGLILLAPFYVILWPRRITLGIQGLEYAFGRRSVFIPWNAVNSLASSSVHHDTLTVQVHRTALDTIEHRVDSTPIGYGARSNFCFLEIDANGRVALTPPIGAESTEMCELIVRVAQAMTPSNDPSLGALNLSASAGTQISDGG
jgi:hypothetical protein